MPRRARAELPDGIYHVTARATPGRALFVDEHDCEGFLWLLNNLGAQVEIQILAYCLMTTHYHLMLEGTSTRLGVLMHRLNGRYAQHYNARHNHYGHLFGERYSAHVLRDEAHFEQALAYIEENPVKAGLRQRAGEWPWTWIAAVHGGAQPVGQTPTGSVPEATRHGDQGLASGLSRARRGTSEPH